MASSLTTFCSNSLTCCSEETSMNPVARARALSSLFLYMSIVRHFD